jgi:hypothetical protein
MKYRVYTKDCTVSINKKCISQLTRAQHTLSDAATVQVPHALIRNLQCVHSGSHDTHPPPSSVVTWQRFPL